MFRYDGVANITVVSTRINAYTVPQRPQHHANTYDSQTIGGKTFTCHRAELRRQLRQHDHQPEPRTTWQRREAPLPRRAVHRHGRARHRHRRLRRAPTITGTVNFAAITDGLSNTMMTSEVLDRRRTSRRP